MPLVQLLSALLLANFENIGALYPLAQWGLPLSWLLSVAFVVVDNSRTRVLGNCLATFTAVVLPIVYLIVRAASLKRGWAMVATYAAHEAVTRGNERVSAGWLKRPAMH